MLFTIADLHFSEISGKPMDVFGSRWRGYREKIIGGWTETVGENDTVIVPGDISWGLTLEEAKPDLGLLCSLPGKKIISRGNHDYWWQSLTRIRSVLAEMGGCNVSLLQNNAVETEKYVICGSRGWYYDRSKAPKSVDFNKICEREALRTEMSLKAAEALGSDKEILFFSHFPIVFGDFINRPVLEALKRHSIGRVYYGHIHGVYDVPASFSREGMTHTIISADYLDFKPLRIE